MFISQQDKIEIFEEILKVASKSEDVFNSSELYDIREGLKLLKISEEFKLPLHHRSPGWYGVEGFYSNWHAVGLFGIEHNRVIPWSDDGRQPENEWLFRLSFPTGGYCFSDNGFYAKETFDAFFNELKTFKPAYSDSQNSSLYFTSKNSYEVAGNFDTIFDKYRDMVKNEMKSQRMKELEKELSKLKEE